MNVTRRGQVKKLAAVMMAGLTGAAYARAGTYFDPHSRNRRPEDRQLVQEKPPEFTPEPSSLDTIFKLDSAQLETLYRNSEHGRIPMGAAVGNASLYPGSFIGRVTERISPHLWQSKTFRPDPDYPRNLNRAVLINNTSLGDISPAKVYIGPSLVDGREAIILDYSNMEQTGIPVAREFIENIRDEIRLVNPEAHIYLGYAFLRLSVNDVDAENSLTWQEREKIDGFPSGPRWLYDMDTPDGKEKYLYLATFALDASPRVISWAPEPD